MLNEAPAAVPRGFHPLADLTQNQEQFARTRMFSGEGGPVLKVPGLLSLESVRLAGIELNVSELRRYPTDPQQTRFEEELVPFVMLTRLPDGTAILLRNVVSNSGDWQAGELIAVAGEWDEAVEPPPPPELPVKVYKKGER
jgi:hypothetical protein